MYQTLESGYQVVYYDPNEGRKIYFPASHNSDLLASKLREARAEGLRALLSQVN